MRKHSSSALKRKKKKKKKKSMADKKEMKKIEKHEEKKKEEEEEERSDVKRRKTGEEATTTSVKTSSGNQLKKNGGGGGEGGGSGGGLELPRGWLECRAGGDAALDIFVPVKTPLDKRWNALVPEEKRHTPASVIRNVEEKLQKPVGLMIDLTNGNRYYKAEDVQRCGVRYEKIRCAGHGESPSPESVDYFHTIVLTWRQTNPEKLVVVHCTHGHNRTGFMIVHHLIRASTTTVRVADAVYRFSKLRSPGIYKRGYLEDLFVAYHEHWPSSMRNPVLPEWKKLSDGSEQDEDEDDEDKEEATAEGSGRRSLWKAAVGASGSNISHEDIIGEEVSQVHANLLRGLVSAILMGGAVPAEQVRFDGSQPVSLSHSNMTLLNQKVYRVTWKADGTRYMILLCADGVYLFNRENQVRRVWVRFPNFSDPNSTNRQNITLLDAELVVDKDAATGRLERRMLIFDVMYLDGMPIMMEPFSRRFDAIDSHVMTPRKHAQQKRVLDWYNWAMEPFKVRRKDFWELRATDKVLKKLIPQLSHESDGLIFQCWTDPYVPRTCHELLKWKYAHMNSVDFQLKVDYSTGGVPLLYVQQGRDLVQVSRDIIFEKAEDPSDFHLKIVECFWDEKRRSWVYMRTRTDKSTPNSLDTYENVKISIADEITEEVLLDNIKDYIEHGIGLAEPP